MDQVKASYDAAFTTGTRHNRLRQTKAYFTFMLACNLDRLTPSLIDILLYIQCLANSFKTILAVKNYISGARSFLHQMGFPTEVFSSTLIQNLFKGLARLSTHVPLQAPALSVNDIKHMCDLLAVLGFPGTVARAAILLGFTTFLRQSNLLPTTGPTAAYVIRRQDLDLQGSVLWVTIST